MHHAADSDHLGQQTTRQRHPGTRLGAADFIQRYVDFDPKGRQFADLVKRVGSGQALPGHCALLQHHAVDRRGHLQQGVELLLARQQLDLLVRHAGEGEGLAVACRLGVGFAVGRLALEQAALRHDAFGMQLAVARKGFGSQAATGQRGQVRSLQIEQPLAVDARQHLAGLHRFALGDQQRLDHAFERGIDHPQFGIGDGDLGRVGLAQRLAADHHAAGANAEGFALRGIHADAAGGRGDQRRREYRQAEQGDECGLGVHCGSTPRAWLRRAMAWPCCRRLSS